MLNKILDEERKRGNCFKKFWLKNFQTYIRKQISRYKKHRLSQTSRPKQTTELNYNKNAKVKGRILEAA